MPRGQHDVSGAGGSHGGDELVHARRHVRPPGVHGRQSAAAVAPARPGAFGVCLGVRKGLVEQVEHDGRSAGERRRDRPPEIRAVVAVRHRFLVPGRGVGRGAAVQIEHRHDAGGIEPTPLRLRQPLPRPPRPLPPRLPAPPKRPRRRRLALDPAVMGPRIYDAADVPFVADFRRRALEDYAQAEGYKAMAINVRGMFAIAVRRSTSRRRAASPSRSAKRLVHREVPIVRADRPLHELRRRQQCRVVVPHAAHAAAALCSGGTAAAAIAFDPATVPLLRARTRARTSPITT